jgi:threonine dehydratase
MMARMNHPLQTWARRVEEASRRIYVLARETPVALVEDDRPEFSASTVFMKLEHLQETGSFKLRGATNKVLALSDDEARRGVVTSSTGNHGLGVAAAARHRGIQSEVYVSSQVSPEKLAKMESYGAHIRQAGRTPLDAELQARAAATRLGQIYISPYNDADVIAGQGTIAIELLRQLPPIDAIYIAVGGGGLISGIGSFMKVASPSTQIVACWPENSRVMYECLQAGEIIDVPELPTLSESTAGGVEPGSITFDLCQRVIDRRVLVSEAEIVDAMLWARTKGWPVEGAAAVAIAAYVKDARNQHGKTIAIVDCGGNASPQALLEL